jgi:tetratricopeptide (TPR) repeat protein
MSKRKPSIATSATAKSVTIQEPLLQTVGNFYQTPFFTKYWKESLIIMMLSFALYHVCIPFGYVLDDLMVVSGNEYTKKGFDGIWDILTTESFEGYFGEKKELVQGNRYRPLSIITFAIEHGILGELNPKVSHIINIILYGFTCILIMMVLTMLFRNFKHKYWFMSIPFLATLIFLVHPIHSEAVANIKGRDEIMSMLFSMGALYASLRYMDRNSWAWLLTALMSYFLGLLSKENAITFVAVIPLTIYFFSETNSKLLKKIILGLLITTFLYLMLRFNTAGVPKFGVESKDVMNNPFLGMTGGEKLGSIMYTLGKYIMLMIFPHPLSHDYYPYAIPKVSIINLFSFLSLIVYIALTYVGFKGLWKKNIYSFSILFYLATLTIVSNIVINLGTFMNERFIFMASAGYCIALAYFLSEHLPNIIRKNGALISTAIAIIFVVGYSIKTYVRVPVWKDALSLNQAAVAVSSNSARANSFMSTALFEEFKVTEDKDKKRELIDQAEFYGLKSVEILPDYGNANLMLIGVVTERFKMDRNINDYIKGMKPIILRRPDIPFIKEFSDYLKGSHSNELFPFYLSIGTELLKYKDGRRNWASQYLQYAYDINPNSKSVNEALALSYELSGNPNEANRFRMAAQNLQ